MALNYLLLFLVSIGGMGGLAYNIKNTLSKEDEVIEYQNEYTITALIEYVKEQIANYMSMDLKDINLNEQEYNMLKEQRNEFRTKLNESSWGDADAKEYIKALIIDMLLRDKKVTKSNIHRFIHFDNIDELSSVDMTEILIYAFSKYCEEETQGEYCAKDGFAYMIEKYHLADLHLDDTKAQTGEMIYDISEKMIKDVFIKEQDGILLSLDFNDKMNILSQRIFEQYKGSGPADLLLDSSVDEVDCGVSGIPVGSFDIDKKMLDKAVFSYESIWIMYHGLNIRVSALKFASQKEFVRVCQNIYRYNSPTVLSRKEGKVTATRKDGSRVLVVRPPFADSYAFLVRKFDIEIAKSPEELFKDEGNEYVHMLMKWLIRGHRNIMFTGSQGTGKTTTMKAFFKYIPVYYNIRVQELTAELNLRFLNTGKNVLSFQETADISTQAGLDAQKKSNGSVNIIGEVATAEAACWIIQTAKVASIFTWASHHAKTARDLVTAIRDNLLQLHVFSDSVAAEAAVADVLNIDVHMEKDEERNTRFIERITEIIPIQDHTYPTDALDSDESISLHDKYEMDMRTQARRITDRQQFTVSNLLEYHDGKYVPTNMPSQRMLVEMKSKIPQQQREEFMHDMELFRKAVEKYQSTNVAV